MELGLEGKVAVITGGSDGIGKAAAVAMVAEGAKVAIAARGRARLDSAYAEISDAALNGGEVFAIQADVMDEESVKDMIKAVTDKWGGINILVNNAGTSSASKFEDMTNEQVMDDLQLKVFGAIHCTRHALPWLKKSEAGAIVNTTTPGGKASMPASQPTSLSRAAGISLTKAWSKEFAPYNLRVNTICVGVFKSGQHRERWAKIAKTDLSYTLQDHWKTVGKGVPLGRIGEAKEAGEVIAFLCSERASYITGAALNVDGGASPVV